MTEHGPTDDIIGTFESTVTFTEYSFPPLFAGFQQLWGEVDVDGTPLEITVGAGLGSGYGTITYGDRRFTFEANQLISAFVAAVKSASPSKQEV